MRLFKSKKKSKHNLPSLDFVTALSIEECRERLAHAPADDSQKLKLGSDAAFSITRQAKIGRKSISYRLKGTFENTAYGTHIQGKFSAEDLRSLREGALIMTISSVLLAVIAAQAMLNNLSPLNLRHSCIYLLIALLASLITVIGYKALGGIRRVEKTPQLMLDWLHAHLYTSPQKDRASVQDVHETQKSQAKKQA